MTSADVACTFNTMNSSAAADYSGVPALASVTTPDSSTVVLNFKAAQITRTSSPSPATRSSCPSARVLLARQRGHRDRGRPGRAPGRYYVLKSFTTQLVTFSANPHYWGGTPPISTVQIPYYSGNTAATTALAAGRLD